MVPFIYNKTKGRSEQRLAEIAKKESERQEGQARNARLLAQQIIPKHESVGRCQHATCSRKFIFTVGRKSRFLGFTGFGMVGNDGMFEVECPHCHQKTLLEASATGAETGYLDLNINEVTVDQMYSSLSTTLT